MPTYLLPCGVSVQISKQDAVLMKRRWRFHRYAQRTENRTTIYLHTLVALRKYGTIPEGMEVDHRNTNKADNRRRNIRLVTHGQNQANLPKMKSRKGRPVTSSHKGVSWDGGRKKWVAQLTHRGTRVLMKRFQTEQEARMAYERKRKRLT